MISRAVTADHVVKSMRRRTKLSSAGSSVSEAIIVVRTASAAPTARPLMNETPISSMPSSEMMTIVPAKLTDRPAVSMAVTVASSGSSPAWMPSR